MEKEKLKEILEKHRDWLEQSLKPSIDGAEQFTSARSFNDDRFCYRVNEWVQVDDFDCNRRNECLTGIHFFKQCQEAVDYDFS